MGSNMGESATTVLQAFEAIRQWSDTAEHRISALHVTPAWGVEDQPDFVNAVVTMNSVCGSEDLLNATQDLELCYGRDRLKEQRWGPRPLDIDLLTYGDQVIQTDRLTVPHPYIPQRLFVLQPWMELDPDWVHPCLQLSVRQMATQLDAN